MSSTWVFGYGSLIFKPSFPFIRSVPGFIRGWHRRFWQGSTDHRGVPGAPGRVVTLIQASNDAIVWGTCYQISDERVNEVLAYLDYREKGGYSRFNVDVWTTAGGDCPSISKALLYTATQENEEFLGPATISEIAFQVWKSVGPSGPNYEYVVQLAASLRSMGIIDEHVFAVEEELNKLIASKETTQNEITLKFN